MRKLRILLVFSSVFILGLSFIFFQNMAPKIAPHEIEYLPNLSIPLSDIVASTSGTSQTKVVYINAHESVFIDQNVEMDQLIINGELHCDNLRAAAISEIKARVIYVNGTFQCGSNYDRYFKKLIISLKPGNVDPRTSPAYRGIVVNNGGKFILNGLTKNTTWTRLAQTALPGQNTITLDLGIAQKMNKWSVGDTIVIGPTSYNSTEAESFTITSINGNMISLSGTLQFRHLGQKETYNTKFNGRKIFDPRAEVANLSRNILIRADESSALIDESSAAGSELGGHVMVMNGGKAYVDSVEFYKMGQAGMMARYPFHWHWVGDGSGQYIVNSSVHHSFQRCIVIHRTNNVRVSNNVCFDFKGHGFFFEDGVEINNILTNNLGIKAKFPHYSKRLLQSDSPSGSEGQGRFPNVATFWISHPQNLISNNVASGSVGSGFWMAFENEIKNSQNQVIANPIWTNTTIFEKNIAHSALVGFTWDGAPTGNLTNNPNNPNDRFLQNAAYNPPTVPIFRNLTAFKNKLTGYYFRGTTAVFDGGVSADNGWHYWLAFHQIVKNSLIIGRSQQFNSSDQVQAIYNNRADRNHNAGIVIYDGPFELNAVDFHNFPTEKVFSGSLEVTPVPISSIAGFDKLINFSQKLSFSPEPIHRLFMLPDSNLKSLELVGSTGIRDIDGSLSGTPGVLVGKRSLATYPGSQCYEMGISHQGFQHCPPNYTETYLTFFGGINSPNSWNVPFVAQRSDGKLNYEKSTWDNILVDSYYRYGGMRIALANNTNYEYEIMFANNPGPDVWAMSEIPNPVVPITKVIAQGQGCYLENIPQLSSLQALKNSNSNGYFSTGNEIYFKLIPNQLYWTIKSGNTVGIATGYKSVQTKLFCNSSVQQYITGEVESVKMNLIDQSVKIKGWACTFSRFSPINVSLKLREFGNRPPHQIATTVANLTSEAAVNFKCGNPNTNGYRFEFNLSKAQAQSYKGFQVLVHGISTNGGANPELNNSGLFTIPKAIERDIGPSKLTY